MKFLLTAFIIGDIGYAFYLELFGEYRYAINYVLYTGGWVAPMLIFAALAVEVIYAVSSRYSPRNFIKTLNYQTKTPCPNIVRHINTVAQKRLAQTQWMQTLSARKPSAQQQSPGDTAKAEAPQGTECLTYDQMNALCAIASRLHTDTTNLITSLGTIAFFLAVYYGRFYLLLTMILVLVVMLLVIFLAVFPWLWINMVVSHIQLEKTAQKLQMIMDAITEGTPVNVLEAEIVALSNLPSDKWHGYHPHSRVKQQLETQHREDCFGEDAEQCDTMGAGHIEGRGTADAPSYRRAIRRHSPD